MVTLLQQVQNTHFYHLDVNAARVWESLKYSSKEKPKSAFHIAMAERKYHGDGRFTDMFHWNSVRRIVARLRVAGAPIGSNNRGYYNEMFNG